MKAAVVFRAREGLMPGLDKMCAGNGCDKKPHCFRFNATPNPAKQEYFHGSPIDVIGNCEEYIPSGPYAEIKRVEKRESVSK